jgi:Mesyanzhinovviridae DNA polymerase
MQMPMFLPQCDWKLPSMSDLPDWGGARRLSYDVETKDPLLKKKGMGPGFYRKDGHIVGFGFTIEGGPSHYLPIRHEGGDNLPVEGVLRYVADNARRFRGELVGVNLGYDEGWSYNDGIEFDPSVVRRDVGIIDPLINELHHSYGLNAIAARRKIPGKKRGVMVEASEAFGFAGKDGKDVTANLHKLPGRYAGEYCEGDTIAPLLILRDQEKDIEKHDLWPIVNLECATSPVLNLMQRRGVRIDLDKLSQIEEWTIRKERELLAKIKHLTGVSLEINQVLNKDLIAPVFQSLGISLRIMKIRAKAGPEYQIDKYLFAEHHENVAVRALQEARKINKLRTTFANSVRRSLVGERIHCTFRQIASEDATGEDGGGRFGRLACKNPNLQQQPSRDEFAEMWRSIYLPEEGAVWYCHDYSQQEPRWVTHFAALVRCRGKLRAKLGVERLTGAAEAAAAYWEHPAIDNHAFMAQVTGIPRKAAKLIYLGLCYGEGGAKLCRDLELPTAWAVRFDGIQGVTKFDNLDDAMEAATQYEGEASWYETAGREGQSIIDKFNERAPFIGQLATVCKERGKASGIIRTAGGRLLHLPRKRDGKYDWIHKLLNRLIQGSAADQIKTAMVTIQRVLPELFMQLQVHDELDGSTDSPSRAAKAAKLMEECMGDTEVPFRVDQEYGPSWGEVRELYGPRAIVQRKKAA